MVRSAKDRVEKFKKKISGDTRKRAYDAQKDFMVKQEAEATRDLVRIELQIKQMVQGQPTTLIPYYIIFGKEIYSKQKKFKYQSLINEVQILQNKWIMRGLDGLLLDTIKEFYVEAYELGKCFHLDISLLDGPDGLC